MPNELHFQSEADYLEFVWELDQHRKSLDVAGEPTASAPTAERVMVGGREYSPEEVAHLRSLPDAEVAALLRAGRRDEWYVAISEGHTPEAEESLKKAAAPAAAAPAPAPRSKWVSKKAFFHFAERLGVKVREHVAGVVDPQVAKIKVLEERLIELEAKLARRQVDDDEKASSLERRCSRHAEHLARLEDRMRKQEGKA